MPSDPSVPPPNGHAAPPAAPSRSEARRAAAALHRAGRIAEAEAAYRRLIESDPRDVAALHLLAILLLQTRRPAEALDLARRAGALRPTADLFTLEGSAALAAGDPAGATQALSQALSLEPNNAQAHLAMGNLRRIAGDREAALEHYGKAADADPSLAEAAMNAGVLLATMGRCEEALAHLERALALRPADPEILANLGFAAAPRDEAAALRWLRQALAVRPDHVQALVNLGALYSGREQPDQAEACFRRALAVDPASTRIRLRLARELRQQSRLDEARRIYDELLAADPALVEAHLGLARVERVAGLFEEERRHLRRVLELEPDEPTALSRLVGSGDPAIGEPELERMRALAEDPARTARERRSCHFALGARAERDSSFEQAFRHFKRGNALRRTELAAAGQAYDPREDAARVDRLIAVFDRALLARGREFGDPSELPVFIVGMPRSGTTLCEQILASHSAVHGGGERADLMHVAEELPRRIAEDTGAAAPPYPDCAGALRPALARRLAAEYLDRLRGPAPQALRITEKLPANFRNLGLIAMLLPGARIIHCRRDPLDTCWSCYAEDFSRRVAWAWDLETIACYYRLYRRLMAHWREVLPNPLLELDYEALVADPEGESRRMIAFCGLDWEERCLRFHETERPVHTASIAQVRRPIYTESVGRWRRYERHLASLREALERQP